jgi:hypothetical protein
MAKIEIVYKVVSEINGKFFSAIVECPKWKKEYIIGREAKAFNGSYLFVFKSLRRAVDWQRIWGAYILRCKCKKTIEPNRNIPDLQRDGKEGQILVRFWKEKRTPQDRNIVALPSHTCWTKSLTPLNVVSPARIREVMKGEI